MVYATMLTPHGKILHDMFLCAHQGAVLLDVAQDQAESLQATLRRYKLRADVSIAAAPQWRVAAQWAQEGAPPADALHFTDPRLAQMGQRWLLAAPLSSFNATEEDYHRHRYSLGVPDGSADLLAVQPTLLECGLDHLHAVDFAKGCYVGQEITARMKYKAALKKTLMRVESNSPLPPPGTTLQDAQGAEIGRMLGGKNEDGLAIARVQAAPYTAYHDHLPMQLSLPAWLILT